MSSSSSEKKEEKNLLTFVGMEFFPFLINKLGKDVSLKIVGFIDKIFKTEDVLRQYFSSRSILILYFDARFTCRGEQRTYQTVELNLEQWVHRCENLEYWPSPLISNVSIEFLTRVGDTYYYTELGHTEYHETGGDTPPETDHENKTRSFQNLLGLLLYLRDINSFPSLALLEVQKKSSDVEKAERIKNDFIKTFFYAVHNDIVDTFLEAQLDEEEDEEVEEEE